jgi:hypothetical protein
MTHRETYGELIRAGWQATGHGHFNRIYAPGGAVAGALVQNSSSTFMPEYLALTGLELGESAPFRTYEEAFLHVAQEHQRRRTGAAAPGGGSPA